MINEVSILIETEFIFEDGSQLDDNQTDPTPEPIPCPLDAQGNEVCPPTDGITPIPGPPPPECPEAGPEVCDEEPPPPDEDPDSNGDAAGDGDSNGNGNGNGEDGSNADGNNGGDSNGGNGGTFDGGGSFFD